MNDRERKPLDAAGLRLDGPLARRHRARLVGEGPDLVVFSHGFGTDQTAWKAVVERLPARCSALLFDLPGASPLVPEGFNPDDYRSITAFADDVLALLDEVGVARCTYVGHSVSGMIGVLMAIEEPWRFHRLVLLNASPRYLNDAGYVGGLERADLEGLLGAMSGNYQSWVAGFAPHAIAADVPQAVRDFSSCLLAMRPDISVRIARTIFESDYRRLLPSLTVPTLLIHAHRDIAVPEAVGHYLHDHIPDSRLAWIDTVGHLPHLSAPDEVTAVLSTAL